MPKIPHSTVIATERQIVEALRHAMPDGASELELSLSTGLDRRNINNYLRRLTGGGHVHKAGRIWYLRNDPAIAAQVEDLAVALRRTPPDERLRWITRLMELI